jgi:peptide/nickel transport system ATP-binding protein
VSAPRLEVPRLEVPRLEVIGLSKRFHTRGALLARARARDEVRAVDDVAFALHPGETLALVGESGSGKTTVARLVLRLVAADAGRIVYRSSETDAPVDVLALRGAALRAWRREVGIVFQDPFTSLNPRMTCGAALAEPLRVHGRARGREAEARAVALLERVGLGPDVLARFPHELSGGQRQRIAIARALALAPTILVLDEAVSALDVSIRAQILNLLLDLQAERGLAYLFITHDLALASVLAARVAVMAAGAIVESGPAEEVLARPRHAATVRLVAAARALAPELAGQRP